MKHGFDTPEKRKYGYSSWLAMKARCLYIKHPAYSNYGGRGITIDPRWLDSEHGFENFLLDMGPRPSLGHSLDRINSNGNYTKDNCKWSTWADQGLHRRTSAISKNLKKHKWWKKKLYEFIHSFIKSFRLGFNRDTPLFSKHIGISFPEFRKYIESLWVPGMSWDNYGKGAGKWCFDHIIPTNKFDLSKAKDRKKCFHFRNIQPMWWEVNLAKRKEEYKVYESI